MPDDSALEEQWVRIGTWLLPEDYGNDYDHFTQTTCPVQKNKWIPLYAKASDLVEGGREWLVPKEPA